MNKWIKPYIAPISSVTALRRKKGRKKQSTEGCDAHTEPLQNKGRKTMVWIRGTCDTRPKSDIVDWNSRRKYFMLNISFFGTFGCGFVRLPNWCCSLSYQMQRMRISYQQPTVTTKKKMVKNTKNVHQESFTWWKNNTRKHPANDAFFGHPRMWEKEKESS